MFSKLEQGGVSAQLMLVKCSLNLHCGMKLFKFSMQKVLDYKELIQNNEVNVLKEMRSFHLALVNELDLLSLKYEDRKVSFTKRCQEGISVKEVKIEQSYLSSLQKQINRKKDEIILSESNIEAQILKVTICKTEKTSIERLKEKELEVYKFMEQKENEIYINEFVANASLKAAY